MNTDPAFKPQTKNTRIAGLPPLAALAMALGMVMSVLIAASTWKEVRKRPDKNNIRITGSARKRIVSDLIHWSATVEANAPERTAAYMALKSGTEKKVSKGYSAVQVISVRSENIPIVEKASRQITSLLEQGVFVSSSSPRYYYTRLGELKLEMLSEAAKDARGRAENILRSAGNTSVGKLVYADMGVININAANSTGTSDEGNNDTTSYEKDIITIVHAEYQGIDRRARNFFPPPLDPSTGSHVT